MKNMRPATEARYRAATDKKYGKVHSDKEWEEMLARYIQQRRARYAVAKNLERGIINAYCCEFCKSSESEAHHPNYAYPLAVLWVCRTHHRREHANLAKMDPWDRIARNSDILTYCLARRGPTAHWSIEEALLGCPAPTEEEEWGSIEDFQETLIEYDEEELARSNADSEDCLPQFIHAMDAATEPSQPQELPPAAKLCPHCGKAIE